MTVADTSLIAYKAIIKKLAKSQTKVLDCIQTHGPVTNKEIARFLDWEINRVTGRTTELRNKGLVMRSGTKIIDGFPSKAWTPVYPQRLF